MRLASSLSRRLMNLHPQGNLFTAACPSGLPFGLSVSKLHPQCTHLILHDPIGWQISIDRYKSQIYGLLEQLIGLAQEVHVDNRGFVDEYLTDSVFTDLERLLRATKSPNHMIIDDPKLRQYVDEEEKLEHKLNAIAYELRRPATVTLVTGPGRIERSLFPLIFLILKRHVQVMYHARAYILDRRELLNVKETFLALFTVVHERVEGLVAVFRQCHANLKEQLDYFAFGMFSTFHDRSFRDPKNNTIFTWKSQNRRAKPHYLDLSTVVPVNVIMHYRFVKVFGTGASSTAKMRHLRTKCDSCKKEVHGSRFICLACINEDFSEQIDLCSQCRNQDVKRKCFAHEKSHPHLQFDVVVLDAELALIIPKAQDIAVQVEDRMRSSSAVVKNSVCTLCGKKYPDLCYQCIQCAMMVYYCLSCECNLHPGTTSDVEKSHIHKTVKFAFYSPQHQLIRVRRAQVSISTDQKLELLRKQVLIMQNRLDAIEEILRQIFMNR
ncbi:hypothetical protein J3R30DRAFT_3679188 [Lentinula aciculospora]|uniref:ZZ-type domain-containing protein n=1 Tax=Lentinula aciculospora TaxID=153920 RepID=A0A9W9AVS7_9AGAR|nr:hypothetical protein J3R30DRAFT_3679188 [Lentinula aciculospora]